CLAVPLDHVARAESLPAAQVRQKPAGQGNGRLTFLRLAGALRTTIKHAPLDIDQTTPRLRIERGGTDRGGARAGVEADDGEPSNMTPAASVSRNALLDFSIAPGRPQQPGGVAPSQPFLPRRPALGQHH